MKKHTLEKGQRHQKSNGPVHLIDEIIDRGGDGLNDLIYHRPLYSRPDDDFESTSARDFLKIMRPTKLSPVGKVVVGVGTFFVTWWCAALLVGSWEAAFLVAIPWSIYGIFYADND